MSSRAKKKQAKRYAAKDPPLFVSHFQFSSHPGTARELARIIRSHGWSAHARARRAKGFLAGPGNWQWLIEVDPSWLGHLIVGCCGASGMNGNKHKLVKPGRDQGLIEIVDWHLESLVQATQEFDPEVADRTLDAIWRLGGPEAFANWVYRRRRALGLTGGPPFAYTFGFSSDQDEDVIFGPAAGLKATRGVHADTVIVDDMMNALASGGGA